QFNLFGPRLHHMERDLLQEPVFLQLAFEEADGKLGAVNGGIDPGQHIGQGSNVVLVAVGQDKGPHPVLVFLQVGDIGNDQVDAKLLFVGEGNAAIDDQDIIPIL